MDLESTVLMRIRGRHILYDLAYIWNLKEKFIGVCKTEIELQIQKTNLWIPGGKGVDKLGWTYTHNYIQKG